MKKVYVASDPLNAHLFKEILDDNGISAVVQDERIFSVRGDVPVVYPSVWVREEDFDAARELVKSFEASRKQAPAGESWTCPTCGERIDGQFAECWKCAAAEAEAQKPAAEEEPPRSNLTRSIVIAVVALALAGLLLLGRSSCGAFAPRRAGQPGTSH